MKRGNEMNTKINYRWTKKVNINKPNNNYGCKKTIILQEGLNFENFLQNNNIDFYYEEGAYYVLKDGEITGEAYLVSEEEPTEYNGNENEN